MARNLEKKREYDRERYKRLRDENLAEVREAERLRKAAQRKRKSAPLQHDYGSTTNPYSTDTPHGASAADRQSYQDWMRDEAFQQ